MPRGIPAFAAQPWPRGGWEYQDVTIAYAGEWSDELNKLGREGWLVVDIIHDEDPETKDAEARVILVRPRKGPPPKAAKTKDEPEKDDDE